MSTYYIAEAASTVSGTTVEFGPMNSVRTNTDAYVARHQADAPDGTWFRTHEGESGVEAGREVTFTVKVWLDEDKGAFGVRRRVRNWLIKSLMTADAGIKVKRARIIAVTES